MTRLKWCSLYAGFAIFMGCAPTAANTMEINTAQNAVRAAQEEGAYQQPQAALHLRLAEEQITKAKEQIRAGQGQDAEYTLMRATSDADLAFMLTKAAKAQADAKNSARQINPPNN